MLEIFSEELEDVDEGNDGREEYEDGIILLYDATANEEDSGIIFEELVGGSV